MRAKLRRLILDGRTYLFSVQHAHHVQPPPAAGEHGAGRCEEIFVAFLAGFRASPVRIRFADDGDQHAGYPSAGVVWTRKGEANLNTPGVARRLIEQAVGRGWTPATSRRALLVPDGFAMLDLA